MRSLLHTLTTTLLAVVLSTPLGAQEAVEVRTLDGKDSSIALSGMTRHVVTADERGNKVSFEGVLLRDVLAKAGVAFGEALRGPALAQFAVVTARDGYRVVFALPELDPAFTDGLVLLADRRDGKRLTAEDGPLRIVAPYEKHASRWVRQVARIEIRDAR